ncbi:hypothetical protein Ahy_B01g051793 [Arachis hypogaea]|uniref:Aminotransferase-like plant mobile domain-containing protein n=1 Tax=Arachis hypogaea TaxID=3818 RepID=A0A445AMS4_ARAHY|nr:hypothetical protein Ahy_B01g051793 [Arachis hypogaea]
MTFQDFIPFGYLDSQVIQKLQLNKNSYIINPGLMGGALYSWDKTSYIFHTQYGVTTSTLLNIAAIIGLSPLGEEILTTTRSTIGVEYSIDLSFITYQNFVRNNKDQHEEPISDNEHITFLFYWLSGVIFCARSIQVEVTYFSLATMLAEGNKLCLAKLFLTQLYLTLDWIMDLMREKRRITNVDSPV